MKGQIFAWVAGVAMIAAIQLYSIDIPFLWDSTWHSAVANAFRNFGTGNLLPPPELDNGNPVLYPLLILMSWNVFGYGLAAPHLLTGLVLVSLLAATIRLGGRFVGKHYLWLLPILLFADPAVLSQSMLMGYDILMLSLTLWAIVCILEGRLLPLYFILPALLLIHTRALAALPLLIFMQLFSGGRRWIVWAPFAFALTVILTWHGWHYFQSGWVISPPESAARAGFADAERWIRQAAYAFWRSLDIGRIGLWLAAGIFAFVNRKRKDQEGRLLLLMAVLPLLIHILLFSHADLPVSPRYFMLSQVMLMLYLLRMLAGLRKPKTYLIAASVIFCLAVGHLWQYPERFGQNWDSQLSFLPWPAMEMQLEKSMKERGISRSDVAALYPLTYAPANSRLNADTTQFADLENNSPGEFNFVLVSSFSNMYSPELKEMLRNDWIEEWKSREGRILTVLYRNPESSVQKVSAP